MKKIFSLLAIASVFSLVSCEMNENDPVRSVGDGFVLRGNVASQTKTSFGTPGAETIPFLWDEGDVIYVNGVESNPLAEGGATVEFTFTSGSVAEGDDVFYGYVDGNKVITLPLQTGQSKNIDGDFGYAVVDDNSEFTLNHYTSYIWLDSYSDDVDSPVTKVVISAENDIVGLAEFNTANKTFGNISSFDPDDDILSQTKSVVIEFCDDEWNPQSKELLSQSSDNDIWALAVTFPVTTGSVRIDYYFENGKMATFAYPSNTLESGNTYKISQNICSEDLYELRVLTFEDEAENTYWFDLIAPENQQDYASQHPLLYPYDSPYCWNDNHTFLSHEFPYNYDTYAIMGGGYVVSKYTGTMEDLLNASDIYQYQISIPLSGGNNNSQNFCVGYHDSSIELDDQFKPVLYFSDDTPRIIDHMYVTNASVTMYCMLYGNGFSNAFDEDDYLDIVATGYVGEEKGKTIKFRLAEGPDFKVDEWVKWDLSSLGAVTKVVFHMEEYQIGYDMWYCTPMYFAFDDVAVRF